jgi:hypothetical protein
MTPLLHRIAKELTLPPKDRTFDDKAGLLQKLSDVHCFEITEIDELAAQLGAEYPRYGAPDELMFLPAPKTWIELRTNYGRQGYLVEEREGSDWSLIEARQGRNGNWWSEGAYYSGRQSRFIRSSRLPDVQRRVEEINAAYQRAAEWNHSCEWLRAVMAIINTPRIIERREHAPHAGLRKKLAAKEAVARVHPWHEVVLSVAPLPEAKDEGDRPESRLTGERALHFCRAYLRIRLGKLELVSAHWRGNQALGVVQTRYRLSRGDPAINSRTRQAAAGAPAA